MVDGRVVTEHDVTVETVRGSRYPHRPVCSCGHPFRGYMARPAAETMADAHAAEHVGEGIG
jgi:hypothetical protein